MSTPLPIDKLVYRLEQDRIEPFWLAATDEAWVADALAVMRDAADHPVAAADDVIAPRLVQIARRAAVSPRVVFAIWALERRRWELRVDAPVDPEQLRDVVFELAAAHAADEALALAALRFRILPEQIVDALFADRRNRRRLVPPDAPASAADVIVRYNLALVQALVTRSMEVDAFVRDGVDRVVSHAKRLGLMAWFERHGDAVRLSLSGPLSLFHGTTKYGRALAQFVPVLASAPAWSLRAHVVLGERTGWLDLDDSGPLGGVHALPADPKQGVVGTRVAHALRRSRAAWRVEAAEILHVGGSVVVPDFVLASDAGRVAIDVVPFATPEHLARKMAVARALHGRLLLCVDARFAPSERMPYLVRYRARIDVEELVAAADALVRGSDGPATVDRSSRVEDSEVEDSPATDLWRTGSRPIDWPTNNREDGTSSDRVGGRHDEC